MFPRDQICKWLHKETLDTAKEKGQPYKIIKIKNYQTIMVDSPGGQRTVYQYPIWANLKIWAKRKLTQSRPS